MKLSRIHGQPSWKFGSDLVDAAITQLGGHLAPVKFKLPHGVIEPYSIAPWAEEKESKKLPGLLQALRGDFFCAPFGESAVAYRGEKHPAHGEVSQSPWKFESLRKNTDETELHLSMKIKVRRGRVDKTIRLNRGQTALYCRHVFTGMSGKMNFGHHATLRFPETEGSGLINTSPISFGQVLPVPFENPANGGYNSLKTGATFSRLNQVATKDGPSTDLSRYPARRGFEDLVMMTHQASPEFAWTAVTFPAQGYVWFALKDPRVLRSTVLWISNGGRHYAPWNGRHVNVMGLEEVTSYFHLGLSASAQPNPVSRRGIATHLTLKAETPLTVNYIMAIAAIPKKWGRVKNIVPSPTGVRLIPDKGVVVDAPIDLAFLYVKRS